MVCRLGRSLCGLEKSPQAWFGRFNVFISVFVMVPCMYGERGLVGGIGVGVGWSFGWDQCVQWFLSYHMASHGKGISGLVSMLTSTSHV